MSKDHETKSDERTCSKTSAKAVTDIIGLARNMQDEFGEFEDFLFFAMPLAAKSRSQHIQDLWAAWINRSAQDPYFVEFGAANGVALSNTYLLEKEFGWSGVVAEPNPKFAADLPKNRDCTISTKCVYTKSGETVDFLAPKRALLGRIAHIKPDDRQEREGKRDVPPIQVDTISLNDLLLEAKAPETIDFMSIDTEGSELSILEAFDFTKWDVRTICVEHSRTDIRGKLEQLLTSNGFFRVWPSLSKADDWYVKAGSAQARVLE
ncbi:MAG: FkbM family methyltransferase [Pseudomonadota bacterium]